MPSPPEPLRDQRTLSPMRRLRRCAIAIAVDTLLVVGLVQPGRVPPPTVTADWHTKVCGPDCYPDTPGDWDQLGTLIPAEYR